MLESWEATSRVWASHPDRSKRYMAAVSAGVFYVLMGLFGATVTALFALFPKEMASGLHLFGIGAAFWGIVAGLFASLVLHAPLRGADTTP